MRRFITMLLLCVTISTVYSATESGRIGISAEYVRHYNFDMHSLDAQEAVVSLSGANFFGDSKLIGIGYSAGYGFPYDSLQDFNPIHINVDLLLSFNAANWLSLELGLGASNITYVFGDTVSNQLGFKTIGALEFRPISHMGIRLSLDYTMPLISIYDKTVEWIATDRHIVSYGISLSYLY